MKVGVLRCNSFQSCNLFIFDIKAVYIHFPVDLLLQSCTTDYLLNYITYHCKKK